MKLVCRFLVLTIVLISGSSSFAQPQQQQPNIVYILVDNWGWGDLGVQGSTVPTPRIDQLAAEGLRLTNFNVQNQCTPTRSALHTGRLPIRSGTQKVAAPGEPDGLSPWEYTIAELLSDAGYATALYGKWHVGSQQGYLPNDWPDNWGQTQELTAKDATNGDAFSSSVAISGDTWVVGAPLDDDAGSASGSAYVFGPPFLKFFIGEPEEE
jgi:arylsulfatase A-like enzyme